MKIKKSLNFLDIKIKKKTMGYMNLMFIVNQL